MAFRRDVLERLGGFDVRLGTGTPARGGEDLAIFIALLEDGGTAGFEPSAVVRHSHRRTEEEFLHQVRAYGTGLSRCTPPLVVRRPSTLLSLARRVPAGVRLLTRPRDERSPSVEPSYPRRALVYQFVGIALGPIAYARSWATARRAAKKYRDDARRERRGSRRAAPWAARGRTDRSQRRARANLSAALLALTWSWPHWRS